MSYEQLDIAAWYIGWIFVVIGAILLLGFGGAIMSAGIFLIWMSLR